MLYFVFLVVSLLHGSILIDSQHDITQRTDQTQIHQLELDLQDMKSKVTDITDRLSHQGLYISDLTSNLTAGVLATSDMASKVSDLTSKYNGQQATISQLTGLIQSIGKKFIALRFKDFFFIMDNILILKYT